MNLCQKLRCRSLWIFQTMNHVGIKSSKFEKFHTIKLQRYREKKIFVFDKNSIPFSQLGLFFLFTPTTLYKQYEITLVKILMNIFHYLYRISISLKKFNFFPFKLCLCYSLFFFRVYQ